MFIILGPAILGNKTGRRPPVLSRSQADDCVPSQDAQQMSNLSNNPSQARMRFEEGGACLIKKVPIVGWRFCRRIGRQPVSRQLGAALTLNGQKPQRRLGYDAAQIAWTAGDRTGRWPQLVPEGVDV